MKRKILWTAALFLFALSSACSSAATPASAGSLTTSGGFPTGSFEPNHPVNVKTLVLKKDDTYYFQGIPDAKPLGTYTVSGDRVTFLESPKGTSLCPKQTGEYTWSFDGSALVFKVMSDICDERRIELTNSTWTRLR